MKPPGRIPEKIRSQQFFFILYSVLDGIEYYCCGKFVFWGTSGGRSGKYALYKLAEF
jgi:hypothetical protein